MTLGEISGSYDLFVSLGSACDPAIYLRNHGLRRFSMPLDWVVTLSVKDVQKLFEKRFAGFMEMSSLEVVEGSANHYDEEAGAVAKPEERKTVWVQDRVFNVLSVHDFPVLEGHPWQASYPVFRERMDRRTDRLLSTLQTVQSTLFVRWAGVVDDAVSLHGTLKEICKGKANLLLVRGIESVASLQDCEHPSDGMCVVDVPNVPGDPVIWGQILQGMSLSETQVETAGE